MPEEIGYEGLGLPSEEEVEERLNFAIEQWVGRNRMIQDTREMVAGGNAIAAPRSTQYVVRTGHTYMLAAIANEKSSRFLNIPEIQVIPTSNRPEARRKSTRLEQAVSVAFREMERNGDGDVWSRVVLDAILLDEGVEKIEAAPAAFWPELVEESDDPEEAHPYQVKKARDEYKKARGLPIRSLYVPLENFFPIYSGPTLTESFEIEWRTLKDVLGNPLFDVDALGAYAQGKNAYKTLVPIIHHCNQEAYSYYACTPEDSRTGRGKSKRPITTPFLTKPIHLYSYEHGVRRTIYNSVGGRFGGWKTSTNRIEGTNAGLLELNQKLDELYSQALTNVGAKYWPNLIQFVDPEQRAYSSGTPPKPVTVKPGDPLTMFKGEDLKPAFVPQDDPMFMWAYDQIKEQIARLGGSPITFGLREPGVNTGYHQAQMITQAEHLDEKLEQHLAQGVINRASLVMLQVKALDEDIWVHRIEKDPGSGKKSGEHLYISPKDLDPMPQLDARVRKTRPIDFVAAVRTALDASSEREGKGPLLDDDTIREDILGQGSPDVIEFKVLRQTQKNRIVNSGVIDRAITNKIGLKLAQEGTPEVDSELATEADPAVVQASQMLQEKAAGMGGTHPDLQQAMADGGARQRGMADTDPQPEARVGEATRIASGGSL